MANCGFANRGIFEERRRISCGWYAIALLIISIIINMQLYFLQGLLRDRPILLYFESVDHPIGLSLKFILTSEVL
jgi:hypothetical protein